MRKKTIGEVLRLARINQGMSLEDLQAKTDIQLEFLKVIEADDFDRLPSPFYTRSFLKKYAWAVDLDEQIVLEAYEEGRMIVYDEIEVGEENLSRRQKKKSSSFLPLFYLTMFSLIILCFVSYYVWTYFERSEPNSSSSSNYSVVNNVSSIPSNDTDSSESTIASSDQQPSSNLTVSGEGENITATLIGVKDSVNLTLSVDNVTSWVSISDTDLAGGVTLTPENKSVSTTIQTGTTKVITLGVVQGVTVTIANQPIDTSRLTSLTGTITLTVNP